MANLNSVKKVDRPAAGLRNRREEVLFQIQNAKSEEGGRQKLYGAALESLAKLLAKGDGPTTRWYFNQLMGTAKTTVSTVVTDSEVYVALGRILSKHLGTEQACEAFLQDLKDELGGHPS